MNRFSPSWALMLLALVLSLHLACSTTAPPKTLQAPPGMVLIPGGTFMMGCTEGDSECWEEEKPSHLVLVKPFFMDKTAVTVKEYQKCVEVGRCHKPLSYIKDTVNWHYEHNDYPMTDVDWNEAMAYCEWMAKRLPSEAEWEYAARGGQHDWKYLCGNDLSVIEAKCMGLPDGPTSVTRHQKNGYGLLGMIGNVFEWVEDCWHSDYSGAPRDEAAWKSGICTEKVQRGSSFNNIPMFMRISLRDGVMSDKRDIDLGFRCAKSVE